VQERVKSDLNDLDPKLLGCLVPLLACLDALGDDQGWENLQPKERHERTQAALITVLKQIGNSQPTLLIIEDLHNADQESIALLTALAGELQSTRLALLLTHRPHLQFAAPPDAPFTQLTLQQLWERSVQELLTNLLGPDPELEPLKAQITVLTDGNPFFIEEIIRELRHSGVLLGSLGAQHLARSLPETLIPPTVQATIASRIDRLSYEDKLVLRSASAFGEVVDLRLLETVTEMQPSQLHSSLDRLRNLELLSGVSAQPASSCRFRHALTRDVAYNSLAAWRKTALHQRIVGAIEALDDLRSTETLALVAAHALGGELWAKAFRCWSELAERAMSQSASGDALAACGNADQALRHLEDSDDTSRKRIDLLFLQISAHFARGDHAEVSDQTEKAFFLAERLEDRQRLVRALSLKAFRSWLNGELNGAISAVERAHAIAREVDLSELSINTAVRLGIHLSARGDYAAAVEPFEWSIKAIPESQISERFGFVSIASAAARSALARTLGELLQFERGRVLAGEAMAIAERYEHPFTLLYVTQEVGILHLRAGDLDEAIRVLSIGHRIALTMPVNLLRPAVMSELGAALVASGQLREGMELLVKSLDCARSLRLRPQFGQQLGYLAQGHLLAGNIDEARRWAREALELTQAYCERGDEAWIRFLLAEIAEQSDPAAAQIMFADVRDLAKRRGYMTLEKRSQERLRPKKSAELGILPIAEGDSVPTRRGRRATTVSTGEN
ncbi:hypothetical protein, partial [Pelagibius sp.]|uniref:ATP-binding protein n=1 Tax=Pelagibius sp. TaxID=1931238 RepID=UPI0026076A39